MKLKIRNSIMGVLSTGAIMAPIATIVACGSTSNGSKVSNPSDKVFSGDDLTVQQLKDKLQKENDAAVASSNFISQIKYELTESLYKKEQIASFDYQKAYLRWNIFATQKSQLDLAKEIAALFKDNTTTSSQISLDPTAAGNLTFIGTALKMGFTAGFNSNELFNFVNNMSKDTGGSTDQARKDQFNSKLQFFKNAFTNIKTQTDKLKKIDDLKDPKNVGWDSSTLTSDYPYLLKPIEKNQDIQGKVYNETKDAFIEKYKTQGDGVAEWTKERARKYNGATTDAEAIKYLVNQQIQTVAFGQFNYKLSDTYTIEQALAFYKDESGSSKHVFPWFEGFDATNIGDKRWTVVDTNKHYVWTNTIVEFANVAINTDNLVEQSDVVTPLLGNKVFYLERKTLDSNNIIVMLDSLAEISNFQNGAPIMITHSLIKATQNKTASNLPWDIPKDSIRNLLEYWGDNVLANAKQGLDMFANLYKTTFESNTRLYNQYISDDTGSRTNSGELGVQTYQWYARKGGMNDGFALATMVAYSQRLNDEAGSEVFKLGNSIGTEAQGEQIISNLVAGFKDAIPQNIKTQIANATNVTDANTRISAWINSLTDEDVKAKFGTLLTDLFANRKVVYELRPNNVNKHDRFLLASPDSGVHIIDITAAGDEWYARFKVDMQLVASEKNIAKAKVDWSKLYSDYFTENEIVSRLIANTEYETQIKNIVSTNKDLFDNWVKAGYVSYNDNDSDAQKGIAIIAAIKKSIEATRINNVSQSSREALNGRITTYLIGQMDSRYIDPTIDPTGLYNELLKSLLTKQGTTKRSQ